MRPGRQPGPGPGRRPPQQTREDTKRFGISSVLSLIGGVLIIASFFLPLLSVGYIIELASEEEGGDLSFIEALPDEDIDDEVASEIDTHRDDFMAELEDEPMIEALGADDFFEELSEARNKEEAMEAVRGYNLSLYSGMRVFMTLDFDGAEYGAEQEARAGGRLIWTSLAWVLLSGLVAVLFALIRTFKPLNAFQVGWAGLFGANWTIAALSMLANNDKSEVFDVYLFQGTGLWLLGAGGLVLWISAFAGLTGKNWWIAPLVGLAVIFVMAGSIIGPAMLLAG